MKHDNDGLNRRAFLKRTALVSAGTVAAGTLTPAAAQAPDPPPPTHGTELRGSNITAQNRNTEGRFGMMFKQLPAYAPPDDLLLQLAGACVIVQGTNPVDQCTPQFLMEEQPRSNLPTSGTTEKPPKPNDISNEVMNIGVAGQPHTPHSLLTTGVTFLGQFIDHDVTFDNTPLPDQQRDPNALTNFRTARFDLDSVYGKGPSTEPKFYDTSNPNPFDRQKFKFTGYSKCSLAEDPSGFKEDPNGVENVPRQNVTFPDGSVKKVAIIPEPRNDQSLIVHQLHIAFMKFHNKVIDNLKATAGFPPTLAFETARTYSRWYFQWIVVHDFLKRIVDPAIVDDVLKNGPKYYDPVNSKDRAFIPVEWAMAAFRFGHSMVRPRYSLRDKVATRPNDITSGVPFFGDVTEPTQFLINNQPATERDNLEGQRPIPRKEFLIQWRLFFNDPLATDAALTKSAKPARKIDATLSFPLFVLPPSIVPPSETNPETMLAKRNLKRGVKVGLPSGQKVAQEIRKVDPKVVVMSNADLAKRHEYIVTRIDGTWAVRGEQIVPDAALLSVLQQPGWKGEAPLWFYILKEAELQENGRRLGRVGGRIVAEVLIGLLKRDTGSYIRTNPSWKPKAPYARVAGQFTIVDLLVYAGVYPKKVDDDL